MITSALTLCLATILRASPARGQVLQGAHKVEYALIWTPFRVIRRVCRSAHTDTFLLAQSKKSTSTSTWKGVLTHLSFLPLSYTCSDDLNEPSELESKPLAQPLALFACLRLLIPHTSRFTITLRHHLSAFKLHFSHSSTTHHPIRRNSWLKPLKLVSLDLAQWLISFPTHAQNSASPRERSSHLMLSSPDTHQLSLSYLLPYPNFFSQSFVHSATFHCTGWRSPGV